LVNRVAELDELRQLWEATKRGEGQAMLIVSEPGVGKSRLTEVLAERIVDAATRLRKLETLIPKLAIDAPGIVSLLANLLSVRIEGEYAQVNMSPQKQ